MAAERYTYGKDERLKSRDAIKSLFTRGKSFNVFPVKIFWQFSEQVGLRAGIGVSTAFFKKATHRNRVKRLMRESYRLQKNELRNKLEGSKKGMDIFIVYRGNALPEFDHLYVQVGAAIERLIKELNEESKQNT